MNPISEFLVKNIVAVFFFYGLAFFTMGVALWLTSRRTSAFRFAQAIRPLALFGIVHGSHEWFEMFQKMAAATNGYTPTIPHEIVRLAILALSFLMLVAFGVMLLAPATYGTRRVFFIVSGVAGVWLVSVLVVAVVFRASTVETLAIADVLSRYLLGIPGALLGTWVLMAQQRTFREYGMPQFGRDLVWCAMALFLYGTVGQVFVRQTRLVPSTVINGALFLQWFGIPVQLFRAVMATTLTIYMMRALNAFELESQRRLDEANQARLAAQAAALEAEHRVSLEMERLNEELRLTAHELSLLLDLSNLLASPLSLHDKLHRVLEKIVYSLKFPDVGMILLTTRETGDVQVQASIGFPLEGELGEIETQFALAHNLGKKCAARALVMCRHLDGCVLEFNLEEVLVRQQCRLYESPVTMIALPLTSRQQVIGSIVLGPERLGKEENLSFDELKLMVGSAQQLGLSIENARLHQEAQEREARLVELLRQVVGAQEAERQRIARELHDVTGQSLTAIALGLRGVESTIQSDPAGAVGQIKELRSFSTTALGELRQTIADLRPSQLDDLGLIAALRWYVQEFEKRYSIPTSFVMEGNRVRLLAEYETVLFRIAQEALTNVVKHADASHVEVKLAVHATQASVTVEDDGRGFDLEEVLEKPKRAGWGLLGIQERAMLIGGEYEIDSEVGRGTRIHVSLPLAEGTGNEKNKSAAG